MDWLETRSMGLYLSMAYGCAAQASLLAGQPERARVAAERALGRAAQSDPFGEVIAYRVFAELKATESGRFDAQVATWLQWADVAARSRATERELALNKLCHARILRRTGESAAAAELLASARQALSSMNLVLDKNTQ